MAEAEEPETQTSAPVVSGTSGDDKPVAVVASVLRAFQRASTLGFTLFLFAFLFRLVGIGWGLPNEDHHWSYHPDEPVILGYSQMVRPAQGVFTPGFYNYGTLYLTLLSVSTDAVNSYGGGAKSENDEDITKATANYHLAGRVLNALAGAALAWVVLVILWRRTHWLGALFGGLAVAVAPGLVIQSRYQTVDVFATFLLALGLHYALKLDSTLLDGNAEGDAFSDPASPGSNDLKFAVLSGIFIGLSAGTKYTGLLGLIALVVVCIYWRKWVPLLAGFVATAIAFLLATPGVLFDSVRFWKDFTFEMTHSSEGHGLVFAGTSSGFVYHFGNLAVGFGAILTVLGVTGLARAVWKRHPWAIALALFGLAYYLLIGRAEVKFLRYTFPLIPVLGCGAGWWVGRAHTHPKKQWKAVGAVGLLGLGGFWGGGAATSVQATSVMADPGLDPRASTAAYFKSVAKEATIGLATDPWFYTPDFYTEAGAPRAQPFDVRNIVMKRSTHDRLLRFVPEDENSRQDWDVRLFTLKPDFVVFSSFETEGIDRLAQMQNVPPEFTTQVGQYNSFMAELQSKFVLVRSDVWNPYRAVHDLMYIRPTIWVWKSKTYSPKPSTGSSIKRNLEPPAATR